MDTGRPVGATEVPSVSAGLSFKRHGGRRGCFDAGQVPSAGAGLSFKRRLRSRVRSAALAAAFGAALVAGAGAASANPFEVFGAGARGAAMGGAMTATAEDWSALHYNVAAMAFQDTNMGFGLVTALDNAQIRLKPRPAGYDLPNLGTNSAAIPSEFRLRPRVDTQDVIDLSGFFFGMVGSFGIDDLRVGALIFTPVNRLGLQQTHFADEREQYASNQLHFELLGARQQRQVIMLGASWRLADALSIGAGISFLPKIEGVNRVYLDNPTDQSDIEITLENDQSGRVAPVVGLMVKPAESLRFGLSWRGELFVSFDGVNEIQVRGFQEQGEFPILQSIKVVQNYTPHTFTFGAAFVEQDDLTVSLDATLALWSNYLNHQGERDQGFEDTISARLGVEKRLSDAFELRAGLGFEPTPVPEQVGRTSYVDNDRVVASIGGGHPLPWMDGQVELSWVMQLHHLVARDPDKASALAYPDCAPGVETLCDELPDDRPDPVTGLPVPEHEGLQTGSPGFPGFQSFGQILSVGLDLRWKF